MDGTSISQPDFTLGALRCERCGRLINAPGGCAGGAEHEVAGSYVYTVAERLVQQVPVGYLHRSHCLVVAEPEVPCGEIGAGYPFGGREMPLRRLRLQTLRVPLDERPEEGAPAWIRAGGQDVDFAVTATDWDGRTVAFTMPLMFVPEPVAGDAAAVYRAFNDGPDSRRTRPTGGQPIALADPDGVHGGPTAVPVTSMTFTLQTPDGRPAWLLDIAGYDVVLDALRHFDPTRSAPTRVVLSDKYTAHGLGAANPTGAFLQLLDEVSVAFTAERAGGLATPDTVVGALSTQRGAVPLAFTDAQPRPDLAAIFGAARLLGIVPFQDVIAEVTGTPTMRTRPVGDTVEVEYLLHATLHATTSRSLSFGPDATLDLQATMSTTAAGTAERRANGHIEGTVTDLAVSVGGVVTVHFAALHFVADAGAPPTVSTGACTVAFAGELAFLADLAGALGEAGFGSGTTVTVTPTGIEAGYAVALPDAKVGVFALAGLALSTRLTLPFTGAAPQLRFAFAHRDRPFTVGVLFLAGTGFFALTADGERGVTEIEAALEFGGNCEIDVVVARGGVHAMVGIYLRLTDGKARISGYVRCGGYLEVLGIVSVTVDFRMGLSYDADTGDVHGYATLTVGISVLFFSKSLTFDVERRFAGSAPARHGVGGRAPDALLIAGPDPDPAPPDDTDADAWDRYCQAFA
ncbi:hypothetical protein ACFPIJ_21690 [Dactylosporangium cerinum]|uniref:Uncharacterized protein n=1 Tax=Dactylosporangium cerinum TaxID=1434730 RepID=A0ABV9VY47_9ACTN